MRLSDEQLSAWSAEMQESRHRSLHLSNEDALALLAEIRITRLSRDEVCALQALRDRADPPLPWGNPQGYEMHLHNRIIAVLDRLITQSEDKP